MSAAAKTKYLSNAQLISMAPAVTGGIKHNRLKESYEIVPTIDIATALRKEGWQPTKAMQARGREAERDSTNRHLVRFRHVDAQPVIGDSFAEIIVMNSHNGACAFNLNAGLFRLVCSNGLVVSDATFAARKYAHHRGVTGEIIEGVYEVVDSVEEIADQMRRYNGLLLNSAKREEFARRAMIAIQGEEASNKYDLAELIVPNRSEDARPSLWNAFNTVQEKVINTGAQIARRDSGRRSNFRGISSPERNVKSNQALWQAMTEFYTEVKAG